MIRSISIVTFVSGNESLNRNIIGFYRYISQDLDNCELIIYSDHELLEKNGISDENIREAAGGATTKYMRIMDSLSSSRYDHILFIDNDIRTDFKLLKKAVMTCPDNVDLCFGKIAVSSTDTFTEHLIKIDKILSHNIIRPALWDLNIGISIPGQVFIIKKKKFKNVLRLYDTLFDDLTIGLCAKESNMTVKRVKAVLGSEKPSANLRTLIRQRIRWAKGYSQTLRFNRDSKCFRYIVIHGAAYHGSVAAVDVVEALLFRCSPCVASAVLVFILFSLSNWKIMELPYALAYLLVFPAVHSLWLITLIKELFKDKKEKQLQ